MNPSAAGTEAQTNRSPIHWPSLATSLDRLADRLLSGEVVFFVGAGFSFDSEGNSTKRLLGRLLARFEGIAGTLINSGFSFQVLKDAEQQGWSAESVKQKAINLRNALH